MTKKIISILIIAMMLFISLCTISSSQNKFKNINSEYNIKNNEHVLYSPLTSRKVYLIDKNAEVVNSWKSTGIPGCSTYLLENGHILTTNRPLESFGLGGGGLVQEFSWDGELVWNFKYSSNKYCLHHDIEPLPNGNILMLGWEKKSPIEKIKAGRKIDGVFDLITPIYSTFIIEVKPTGINDGEIIWEWHLWDHLVQDKYPNRKNYASVEEHPELVNINYARRNDFTRVEWIHANAIDYNPTLDQIIITARHFSEFWIIDHSTNSTESTSHEGGKYGKGGDILFRWGNPSAYDRGKSSDQKLFYPHDAKWIESNRLGKENILVFNNGNKNRRYSTVDEIKISSNLNGTYKNLEKNETHDAKIVWSYFNDKNYYKHHFCGAQRLQNNNTLICYCFGSSNIIEVTPEKEVIWSHNTKSMLFNALHYNINITKFQD